MKHIKHALISCGFFITILTSCILIFNYKFIPRGLHLAKIFPLESTVTETDKASVTERLIELITFKKLSYFLFSNSSNYCDAAYYGGDNEIILNKNGTINFLMAAYIELPNNQDLLNETRTALRKCDINEITEDGLNALQRAILYRSPALVKEVLKQNPDRRIKTSFPGKSYDNLEDLEFADFLLKKSNIDEQKKLNEIVLMLSE